MPWDAKQYKKWCYVGQCNVLSYKRYGIMQPTAMQYYTGNTMKLVLYLITYNL